MQPTDYVLTLLSSAAVSTALAAAMLWLTKAWIGERLRSAIKAEYDIRLESHKAQLRADYDHQLETHKIQLKSQSDIELERLKSSLSVAAAEQNATFSRLHERRVDVIAKTYSLLRRFHFSVAEYTKAFEMTGEKPRQERQAEAAKASREFSPYFSENQIFLPKRVATQVQAANRELIVVSTRFAVMVDRKDEPNVLEWVKISEKLEGDVQLAIEALEDELRKLLGDRT